MNNSGCALRALLFSGLLFATCCAAAPPEPRPAAMTGGGATQTSPASVSQPLHVNLSRYVDGRPAAPSRKIGDIRTTVIDMHGTELLLDQDVSAFVTNAMLGEFGRSGFRATDVDNAGPGNAAFAVTGSIKDLTLNVAGRDEVSIVVETTVRDRASGKVIWSGVVTEKADRYAGVTGNTRKSIMRYLDGALATVTAKTVSQAGESMRRAHPELLREINAMAKAVPGVKVLVAVPAPEVIAAAPVNTGSAAAGRLSIVTNPARAKVYLGDVYYGLSPLKLDLEPGVHALHVKLDGFKTVSEKVSVRKGDTTELELTMER